MTQRTVNLAIGLVVITGLVLSIGILLYSNRAASRISPTLLSCPGGTYLDTEHIILRCIPMRDIDK